MFFIFTPYALALFLVSFVSLILFLLTYRKRNDPGGYALLGVMISLFIWSFFAGLSAGFSAISYKLITIRLAYLGIVSLPVNLLLFSLYYTSYDKFLNPFRIFFLWFIPLIGMLLILTNEQHGLMWTNFAYRTTPFGSVLAFERGIGFWWLTGYLYTCVLFTYFLIIWTAFQFRYIFKKNMFINMFMIPFSLLINILYVAEVFPAWKGYDPTSFSLVLFCSLLVWSFNKHKYFDLTPVGREIIIDQMRAMLLIIDKQFNVVDINQSMLEMISNLNKSSKLLNRKSLIGKKVQDLFPEWPTLIEKIIDPEVEKDEIELNFIQQTSFFEIQKTKLERKETNPYGFIVFLFDITEHKRTIEAEIRNREIAKSLSEIALVVNSSLDPKKTLDLALDQIGKIIKFDFANISLLRGDYFQIEFEKGHDDPENVIGMKIQLEDSPNQETLIHRQPVMYGDVQKYYDSFKKPPHHIINSFLCLPMYAKDEVLGFLSLGSRKKDCFTNEDLTIAGAFASQVAIALQNSYLYSKVNRNLFEQSIMNEIIRIGSTRTEKKEFAISVTDQIHRFIESPGILVIESDQDAGSWGFIDLSVVKRYDLNHQYALEDGITGYILKHAAPLLLNSIEEIETFLTRNNRKFIGPQPKTYMGAPMVYKDRVIGAIIAHDLKREFAYSQDDFNLFVLVTAQAAIGFENVRLISQLDYLAKTDALTGIYNRGHFQNVSKNILDNAEKNKSNISMIMMDIDLFKGLNDSHGHHVGDRVLQTTVEACKSILRDKDIIGRVGGEEFSIVLPDTNLQEAQRIAERIRSSIEKLWIDHNGTKVRTTVSLGVASLHQLDHGSLDTLSQISDQALYQAKANGRNCVQVYQPQLS